MAFEGDYEVKGAAGPQDLSGAGAVTRSRKDGFAGL